MIENEAVGGLNQRSQICRDFQCVTNDDKKLLSINDQQSAILQKRVS